jgi:hypothetical protein
MYKIVWKFALRRRKVAGSVSRLHFWKMGIDSTFASFRESERSQLSQEFLLLNPTISIKLFLKTYYNVSLSPAQNLFL